MQSFEGNTTTNHKSEIETFEIPRSKDIDITEAFKDQPLSNFINILNQKICLLPEIEEYNNILKFLSLCSKAFFYPDKLSSRTIEIKQKILEDVHSTFSNCLKAIETEALDQTDEIPIIFDQNDSPIFPKTELKILRALFKSQELEDKLESTINILLATTSSKAYNSNK